MVDTLNVTTNQRSASRKKGWRLWLSRGLTGLGLILGALVLLVAGFALYLRGLAGTYPSGCLAMPPASSQPSALGVRLQQVLDRASSARDGVGIQVSIITADGEIWTGTSGYANRGHRCPVVSNNLFHIGSVTKMYTAALLMKLVEGGGLSLSDPVSFWTDRVDPIDGITVRQLLTHTSGLADYTEDGGFQLRMLLKPNHKWQPEQLLVFVTNRDLNHFPVSQYKYANSNFVILGLIIEAVGKNSFGRLLEERLLFPGGLKNTYFLDSSTRALPVVHGYDEDQLHLGRLDLTSLRKSVESAAFSAGAVAANSEDVARFTQALFKGLIISEESLADMTNFLDIEDEYIPGQTGYGFGLMRFNVDGHELWGHEGVIPGFSSVSVYSPDKGYVITVLTNLSVVDRPAILAELQAVLLDP